MNVINQLTDPTMEMTASIVGFSAYYFILLSYLWSFSTGMESFKKEVTGQTVLSVLPSALSFPDNPFCINSTSQTKQGHFGTIRMTVGSTTATHTFTLM